MCTKFEKEFKDGHLITRYQVKVMTHSEAAIQYGGHVHSDSLQASKTIYNQRNEHYYSINSDGREARYV